ncbi:hypothetical protein MtrunA17_Chr3g0096621 [Medicago truncatula]|uniref:Uncharacterized protein n=1 Tax=Medicago truncatula TaxID=3880 RepID=A0A396IR84_MEDTR|nr:hypothetical protein MtrunA17_Chr3g0096621 [Medicago truncatula]
MEAEDQVEPAMEYEPGPQGFPGGAYEFSLLPNLLNTWHAGFRSINNFKRTIRGPVS